MHKQGRRVERPKRSDKNNNDKDNGTKESVFSEAAFVRDWLRTDTGFTEPNDALDKRTERAWDIEKIAYRRFIT